jgi:hypothetical protein
MADSLGRAPQVDMYTSLMDRNERQQESMAKIHASKAEKRQRMLAAVAESPGVV